MADTRERLSAEDRKAQILRCAANVFARSSYRVAGMAEIAKEAGISEPTVYKHFASKRELFLTILDRVGESTLRHWSELLASSDNPITALRRIGLSQYEMVTSHPESPKIQFQALSEVEDPEIQRTLHRNFASYIDFLAQIVQQGKQAGSFSPGLDVRAAAWQLLSVGFTLNLTSLLGFEQEFSRETLEVMGDNIVVTFGTALGSSASASADPEAPHKERVPRP